MNPSWSIFDCRQLISFRLPLTQSNRTVFHTRGFSNVTSALLKSASRKDTFPTARNDADLNEVGWSK